MSNTPWNVAETALLQRWVQDGLDSQRISQEFGKLGIARTYKACSRKIQQERKRVPGAWHAMVAQSPFAPLQEPPTLDGNTLLLFDLHIPWHDAKLVNQLNELALKWGVENLGIGGDLLDLNAFSWFGRTEGVEARREFDAGRQAIRAFSANFKHKVYAPGNHEMRLSRLTGHALQVQDAMMLWCNDPTVITTDHHWFWVLSGGQTFQIEHPKGTSIHAAVVPAKLCSKYQTHVIAGHGHIWGISKDTSGKFWAVDAGVCCDSSRMEFGNLEHNTRPMQMKGAVIIMDGIPILLTPGNINFFEGMRRG